MAVRRWPTPSPSGSGTPRADCSSVERTPNLWQAAALGQMTRVHELVAAPSRPTAEEITNAFWCACHGGQRATAEYLLDHGADINWIGHDDLTPLDAAARSDAHHSSTGCVAAARDRPRSGRDSLV